MLSIEMVFLGFPGNNPRRTSVITGNNIDDDALLQNIVARFALFLSCLFCSPDLSLFAKIAFAFERVRKIENNHSIEDTFLYQII